MLVWYDTEGNRLTKDEYIARECVNYYTQLFGQQSASPIDQLAWDQIQLQHTVSEEDANGLELPVTNDEIVYALSTIDSDKAPWPDGFSSHFFKRCWRIIGTDFIKAIKSCFSSSKILGEVNATLICLIPKTQTASILNDFRPITCCNTMYKCITKILTVMLKHIVKKIVSPCQSAFISGRSIQDNIMLAHELLRNYHRDSGAPRCVMKIDLRKAYDCIRWDAFLWLWRSTTSLRSSLNGLVCVSVLLNSLLWSMEQPMVI